MNISYIFKLLNIKKINLPEKGEYFPWPYHLAMFNKDVRVGYITLRY